MPKRFSPHLLKTLRNNISIDSLIADVLEIPNKSSEGYFRFLCPICSDFHTATKKQTLLVVSDVRKIERYTQGNFKNAIL